MSRYNSGARRGGAKEMTKNRNRYLTLDSDIASAYDDHEDDSTSSRCMPKFSGAGRLFNRISNMGSRNQSDRAPPRPQRGPHNESVFFIKIGIPKDRQDRLNVTRVLKTLNQQIDDFKPLLPTSNMHGNVEFFVRNAAVADALKGISKRVVYAETGDRMWIQCERRPAPWTQLEKKQIQIINEVVDSRYNAESRALDLSEFVSDPKFKEHRMLMSLTKNNVMMAVMDRIDDQYGSITAISLKGNRLRHLAYAAMLTSITKFIVVLDLSNNQIESMDQVRLFKGLPVKNLFFEGNPICESYNTIDAYNSKLFDVPPPVSFICIIYNTYHGLFTEAIFVYSSTSVFVFVKNKSRELQFCRTTHDEDGQMIEGAVDIPDEDEKGAEMKPVASFFGSAELQALIGSFLTEFFALYDGSQGAASRKQLMPAYDQDNSTFTLTLANVPDSTAVRYHNDDLFKTYIRRSHNIQTHERFDKGTRTSRGAMEIVVQLSKLPITRHLQDSLVIDVHLKTDQLLGFTVQGLFEDGKLANMELGEVPTLSYFSRNFIVSPREGGAVAVVSDMLYISGLNTERVERYKHMMNKCATATPSTSAVAVAPAVTGELTVAAKEEMAIAFSRASGMKIEWSAKCLEESAWNWQVAENFFAQSRASIPAEAFL